MKPASIRLRLTAWYVAVLLLSLAAFSAATFFGLRAAIESTVDRSLLARSQNIARLLAAQPPQQEGQEPQPLFSVGSPDPNDQLYQIADAAGRIIYQTPAMQEWDVPLGRGRAHSRYRHHRDDGDFTTYSRRARDVRVLTTKLEIGHREYSVQVASIVSPLYDLLSNLSFWAWTGLPVVACTAGLTGYWLSGRALKPVREIAAAARTVSERNLAQRLPVTGARDELWELADTINSMLARLEAAFLRIVRFTSDASHELRTPIAVIRTTSEVALEQERSAEDYQRFLVQVLGEAEAATELIGKLLTLARADADMAQLHFEPTDLREIIEEVSPAVGRLAESRALNWSMQIAEQAAPVLGDRAHLRQMLLILVENACRYTREGGAVRLRLATTAAAATLEVSDTGIGIPEDEQGKVLERFYRASNARFFDPDGTGLGLSIAHWIAVSHGATLTISSAVARGTSVSIVFEAVPAP